MAEPTLSLKKTDYEEETGIFLGYGRGPWVTAKEALIQSYVKSGLRKFYFPALPGGETYEWSFLRPSVTLGLASAASTIQLPDDYGGIEGHITVVDSDRVLLDVPIMGVGQVQQRLADASDNTGPPLMAAVRPKKGPSHDRGQRFELVLYPVADQAYSLQVRYYITPNALTGDRPYVYGGPEHHETILEACLASAEQRGDDAIGTHSMLFQERLAASIRMDRRHKPQTLGYNGDRSDGAGAGRRQSMADGLVATFNGTEYD